MIWLLGGYIWLFVHRPFEVWPVLGTLQIERIYALLMLVVWTITPGKGLLPNRIHLALGVFALALAASWLLSPYADAPGCPDLVENYFKVSLVYVLMVTTVRDERSLRLLVLLFLAAVGLYMAHSALEYVRGRYQWRMGTTRMIGVDVTYSDPNAFAAALLYALPLTVPFWLERPRRVPRWVLLGFTVLAAICILRTGSRAGFVGLVAFAGLTLLIYSRRKGLVVLLGGLGALAGLAVLSVALPEDLQNRYFTLIDSSRGPANAQESAGGRMLGFLQGLAVWQQSPLLGHGPGSYPLASGSGFQAHNLYGQVMSEMGLLGAVCLLGLLACFAANGLEVRRLSKSLAGRAPPLFAQRVCGAVVLAGGLMLLLGWAGHNLYRYHWQWFAAFQAIAVHCVRVRARAAAASYALPDTIFPCARAWAESAR
jgi:O-antigen ligase